MNRTLKPNSRFFISLVILFTIAIWEVFVNLVAVPLYLFPPPSAIASKAFELRYLVLEHLMVTVGEIVLGFMIGTLGAIFLASLIVASNKAAPIIMPFAIGLKTVPLVAVAPLFVIWFGDGILTKVLLAALICFLPVLVSIYQGLINVDSRANDLLTLLDASKWQKVRYLYLPSLASHLFGGLKVAIVLAVIGAIVGEFAAAKKGVGFQILMASYQLDTVAMFVYIFIMAFTGIALFKFLEMLESVVIWWKSGTT